MRFKTAATITPQRPNLLKHREPKPRTSPIEGKTIQSLKNFRKIKSSLRKQQVQHQGWERILCTWLKRNYIFRITRGISIFSGLLQRGRWFHIRLLVDHLRWYMKLRNTKKEETWLLMVLAPPVQLLVLPGHHLGEEGLWILRRSQTSIASKCKQIVAGIEYFGDYKIKHDCMFNYVLIKCFSSCSVVCSTFSWFSFFRNFC